MDTWLIYFPFLTCEVKYGAAKLDIANWENDHNVTLVIRGVVEPLTYESRKGVYREKLAFLILYNYILCLQSLLYI